MERQGKFKSNLILLLAAIVAITSVIMACTFMPKIHNHYCTGHDCQTCAQIEVAKQYLTGCVSAAITLTVAISLTFTKTKIQESLCDYARTLVSLKVLILS